MGRILNKEEFKSIGAELPAELVDKLKKLAKSEHKNLTQKLRELIEKEVQTS